MRIEEQVLSREQMAHLKELGVDTSDASMMWYCCKDAQKERWYLQINNELSQCFARMTKGFVPTYTIGDLIGKLPKQIAFTFSCESYKYERSRFSAEVRYQLLHTHDSNLKEDLYNALCFVAKNHKELIK